MLLATHSTDEAVKQVKSRSREQGEGAGFRPSRLSHRRSRARLTCKKLSEELGKRTGHETLYENRRRWSRRQAGRRI